jgi:RNA polymerase sigma factor (sigma-70 family)
MSTDLIAKIRENPASQRAWATWYKSVYPKVYYAAFRFVRGNTEAARDLASETFTRFLHYQAIERVASDQHAQSFLIKTCRNLAIDRGARPEEVTFDELDELETVQPTEESLGAALALDKMVQVLNPEERQLVEWIRAGLNIAEAAKKLGISYTAAGVRVHRIRHKLRETFGSK